MGAREEFLSIIDQGPPFPDRGLPSDLRIYGHGSTGDRVEVVLQRRGGDPQRWFSLGPITPHDTADLLIAVGTEPLHLRERIVRSVQQKPTGSHTPDTGKTHNGPTQGPGDRSSRRRQQPTQREKRNTGRVVTDFFNRCDDAVDVRGGADEQRGEGQSSHGHRYGAEGKQMKRPILSSPKPAAGTPQATQSDDQTPNPKESVYRLVGKRSQVGHHRRRSGYPKRVRGKRPHLKEIVPVEASVPAWLGDPLKVKRGGEGREREKYQDGPARPKYADGQ